MANNCFYELRVKGKKERCITFAKWLAREEGETECKIPYRIGCRIFSAEYDPDILSDASDEDEVILDIIGDCAWSVYSCMFPGENTYAKDNEENPAILTVPAACAKLGVRCEIFSSEPMMCFAEHYLVSEAGNIELDETTDYWDICCEEEDSYQEFLYNNPSTTVTEETFNKAKEECLAYVTQCEFLGEDGFWPFTLNDD